ncbi:glyoxylate/hydroxypyruvate reductase A [Muriicola jejuensis]|uniref:Glyoxylate/hydroxypyruvate reductase A n=1 Tax=Muriicola jejuensis TaxID=504488 RepID=A0A6P0ULY6_9FLAO|nr:glyoxylate/hydroxypyruvate reductase A [Muriicola jejuensis]NER11266.1 glyoxylate/hydroxypyruvate reductase A [Muriicola jejuensis]SMP21822.1 glyoxylate/hydroxypyruvate reductase A [Muriicola jejuensis]
MAIVLIRKDGKLGLWKKAFLDQYPSLPVYHFEEEHPAEKITMAVVWKHPKGSLKAYPNLKCIASFGAGVDFIFGDPTRPEGVPITRVVDDALANDMAEYVITAIMGHLKNMDQYARDQEKGLWQPRPYSRIADHTIGIMGIGTLGTQLADKLRVMGFRIIGWSKNPKELPGVHVFHGIESRREFLSKSTVLVCLLPLTPETKKILNQQTLSQLPHGAFLINVARGGHLEEGDLIPLLDSGQLSGACLDVFEEEPLPSGHLFWEHPKIRITPHVASVSDPQSVVPQLAENFFRLREGKELRNQVDLQQGY